MAKLAAQVVQLQEALRLRELECMRQRAGLEVSTTTCRRPQHPIKAPSSPGGAASQPETSTVPSCEPSRLRSVLSPPAHSYTPVADTSQGYAVMRQHVRLISPETLTSVAPHERLSPVPTASVYTAYHIS